MSVLLYFGMKIKCIYNTINCLPWSDPEMGKGLMLLYGSDKILGSWQV